MSESINVQAARMNARLALVSMIAMLTMSCSSTGPGEHCESTGPADLRPKSFASIRIGMARTEVHGFLGAPDYSPIEGQDYHSTPGECELEPGRTASCGFVIEYRDTSKDPAPDTGRIVECRWGAIGE